MRKFPRPISLGRAKITKCNDDELFINIPDVVIYLMKIHEGDKIVYDHKDGKIILRKKKGIRSIFNFLKFKLGKSEF